MTQAHNSTTVFIDLRKKKKKKKCWLYDTSGKCVHTEINLLSPIITVWFGVKGYYPFHETFAIINYIWGDFLMNACNMFAFVGSHIFFFQRYEWNHLNFTFSNLQNCAVWSLLCDKLRHQCSLLHMCFLEAESLQSFWARRTSLYLK